MRLKVLLDLITKIITLLNINNILKSISELKNITSVFNLNKIHTYVSRLVPQQHNMYGTVFHRVVGERLFNPLIWKPTKEGVAGGLSIGVFIALTPTIGTQTFLSIMAAYFLRVNIPAAVIACLITNPLTAPIIYPLQYKLGTWLIGIPHIDELEDYPGRLRIFFRYAKPLWVGSLISATLSAAFTYIIVFIAWERVAALIKEKFDIR